MRNSSGTILWRFIKGKKSGPYFEVMSLKFPMHRNAGRLLCRWCGSHYCEVLFHSYPYSPTLNMLTTLLMHKQYTSVSCLMMVIANLTYLFTSHKIASFNFLQFVLQLDFFPNVSFIENSKVNVKHLQNRGKIIMGTAYLTRASQFIFFVLSVKKKERKMTQTQEPQT